MNQFCCLPLQNRLVIYNKDVLELFKACHFSVTTKSDCSVISDSPFLVVPEPEIEKGRNFCALLQRKIEKITEQESGCDESCGIRQYGIG